MTKEYVPNFSISRDRHLFGPGPKCILALDGGGVRGAITVAFLERIESLLVKRYGPETRLCDYFDLVGGTSTGAIIAGAIALGKRMNEIKDFYHKLAPMVFPQSYLGRLIRLRPKFDADALRREINKVVDARTLESTDLKTGLCIIAKRMDTGSPWIVANNPRAPYWETVLATADKKGHIGNKEYLLASLVRASTAAPFYFDPEYINIVDGEPPGLFVDGGVTPHNNPSLVLFMMSYLKAYGMRWPTGMDNLRIVSIGTGSSRDQLKPSDLGFFTIFQLGYRALLSLMNDAQTLVLAQMQWLGQCSDPWVINSEWKTMSGNSLACGPLFRFMRYDVTLEQKWLEKWLGRKYTESEVSRLRRIDDASIIHEIHSIAADAAAYQIKEEDWL